jgi:hypothetical protein
MAGDKPSLRHVVQGFETGPVFAETGPVLSDMIVRRLLHGKRRLVSHTQRRVSHTLQCVDVLIKTPLNCRSSQFYSFQINLRRFRYASKTSIAGASVGRLPGCPETLLPEILLWLRGQFASYRRTARSKGCGARHREFGELIEDSGTETNLRLGKTKLHTWRPNLILCMGLGMRAHSKRVRPRPLGMASRY